MLDSTVARLDCLRPSRAKVVANVDVLGALVQLGVLGRRDRALVVFVDNESIVACFFTKFTHERLEPHRFLSRFRQRHVLCLGRRECHAALILDAPADTATVEHEHVLTGAASRFNVFRLVGV